MRQYVKLLERYKEGLARADRRAGEVVAMLYNVNRDGQKDPKGRDWTDFFPEHKPPKKVMTDEEMLDVGMMWTKVDPIPE